MAKVALLLAIKKLRQLSLAEESQLIGADSEISDLVQSLENLQQELTSDDQIPRESAREIEDLVYRVEYMVEILASRSFRKQFRFNILCRGGGVTVQKQARSEITRLCIKIQRLLSPDVLQLSADVTVESSSWHHCREQWKHIFEHELKGKPVGIEEEKRLMLRALLDKSDGYGERFEVIPIWGRSGTGKRTLAHAIYNDPSVVEEFGKHRIIIPLSENFNFRRAFLSILRSMGFEDCDDFPAESVAELIRQHLQESRRLILLEDIRSIEDWRRLRLAVAAKGSRILVTTRSREIAEGMKAAYIHEKRPLTVKSSWELLKKASRHKLNPGFKCYNSK